MPRLWVLQQAPGDEMSRADFLNKERWDAQRNTTVSSKLDRIIALLEALVSEKGNDEGE